MIIDKAEAVLIRKIAPPFNAGRVKTLKDKYSNNAILSVNHRRRHRLAESVSTCADLIHTGQPDFMLFGTNGHPVKPPIPPLSGPAEEA